MISVWINFKTLYDPAVYNIVTDTTVVKDETHNATLALDLQREGLQSIDDSALDVTVQRGE